VLPEVVRDQECLVHVQVLFVQVLLHDHQVRVHLQVVKTFHHVLVHQLVHQLVVVHIKIQVQVHRAVHQVHLVQVVDVRHNVVVQVEHLVRMQARVVSANQNQERLCVMNSTICKHHNSVEQLFLTVMELLQFVCVAVLLLQILPKKLMQIQQR
jgi:hypothetical protein